MAHSDKNIVITPNVGSTSADPRIVFSGADAATGPQNITVQVYPTNSGTLSFEGSAGQLFAITNSLSGSIFSVNDISGIPSIEVLDTGNVKIAQYGGDLLIGTDTDNGVDRLQVNGSLIGTVLKSSVATGTAPLVVASTTRVANLNVATAGTADTLTTARTINGVSFNGSANITVADSTKLPLAGGTMTGAITFAGAQTWPTFNQSTTGSAATLTTTRTIWGQNFNGSANVTGALSGATTLSMSGQLTNTVAVGTAPFVITSTTRVANLNVATAGASDSTTASTSFDTRSTATTPESFGSIVRFDFKANTTNGLADGGSYNGAMYWRKYASGTDWSGGGAIELAYTDNARLWMRYGASATWGAWKRVIFGENFDNGGSLQVASLGVGMAASGNAGQIDVLSSGNTTGSSTRGIDLNAAGSGYLFGTTGDGASSTIANVKLTSWFGIGFSPSITGQAVPQWENAAWIDVRSGAISARNDITAYSSDVRLKTNFINIQNPLEKLKSIGGYEFDWLMDKCRTLGFQPNNIHEHGVKAQEIQRVMPDAVTIAPFDDNGEKQSKSGENYLTVKYEKLVPLLVEAIKEIDKKYQNIIENLIQKVESLEAKINGKQ